jgi:catechol 2,3-dioxygenase-like lactoylglutathione lyase family enzyme
MSVSSLREITLGVSDLPARSRQFEKGCGLQTLTSGAMTPITAGRLFDLHVTPKASLLGRPEIEGSPRLRLVEVSGGAPARASDLRSAGPFGIGFTTRGMDAVRTRLQGLGMEFSRETLGSAEDGDVIALREEAPAGSLRGPGDCSEPHHASFVVTNLDACLHFMQDALEQETLTTESDASPHFDSLRGASPAPFKLVTIHRPGQAGGHVVFVEFERRLEPMSQTAGLARGVCRLRYDTADLHSTLARVPGGGGALVRGPASIDDPVLGRALVAMVRAPFGVLIELWQTG